MRDEALQHNTQHSAQPGTYTVEDSLSAGAMLVNDLGRVLLPSVFLPSPLHIGDRIAIRLDGSIRQIDAQIAPLARAIIDGAISALMATQQISYEEARALCCNYLAGL